MIIRATDEATLPALHKQLQAQKLEGDQLTVLNQQEKFEKKLIRSYELAVQQHLPYTLLIDADILVVQRFRKKVDQVVQQLSSSDFGFGLRLFDRFYQKGKYRGIHIYRTELLPKALEFLPLKSETLRPESFVKSQMAGIGSPWRNNISEKIVGLHDYFQYSHDVFYKYFVRAFRSEEDLEQLIPRFKRLDHPDFRSALAGVQAGLGNEVPFTNNKGRILQACKVPVEYTASQEIPENIDGLLCKAIFKRYGWKYLLSQMFR